MKSLIVVTTYFLWKARCDAIFRNISRNFEIIAHRVLSYTQNIKCAKIKLSGSKLILNNFTNDDGFFLFSSSNWNDCDQVSSSGFFISSSNYFVSLVDCASNSANNQIVADIQALLMALKSAVDQRLPILNVFNSAPNVLSLINLADPVCS